ncbi:MAG: DNA polymerase I [Gemmatimonadetes bacterium]|nr:MAG: DNA polymerase I [Gemmatimonadota bacterium]
MTDPSEAPALVERIRAAGSVAVEAFTSFPDPHRAPLVGLALAVEPGEAFYLSFGHTPPGELALDFDAQGVANLPAPTSPSTAAPGAGKASAQAASPSADPSGAVGDPGNPPELRALWAALADPEVRKVGADLKATFVTLARAGRRLEGLAFDTGVASYVLDPGRRHHDLAALAHDLLALAPMAWTDVVGSGQKRISFAEVEQETAARYAGERVDLALRLEERFRPRLVDEGLAPLFDDLEMPLLPVLARMEMHGVRIDPEFFRGMSHTLEHDLELIRDDIYKLAGTEFNLNSTQQLREILFEKQGLPVVKRTKTGPSTDSSVLEELAAQGAEIPLRMLEYRELEKLRSTYVDALPQLVNPRTGRIHTRFNQTVAATGRLSSSDPNLQNIPIRTELGRSIRRGFVPEPGFVFFGADYSQIELRVLAHFSGDEAFVTAFTQGIDVHRQTASVIFDVPLEDVTDEQRARAKTINFATLYGQGAFSLARQLGIPRDEAQAFIDEYFERFAGVRAFLDEQVRLARERGYVETLLGRRRYVPELRAKNWNIRQFGERVAQNTPIQGTAADLIKKAMLDVDAALTRAGSGARMLLQVHDELLLEVPEGEEEAVARIVTERMESAIELSVPLVVEGGFGRSWYETKG